VSKGLSLFEKRRRRNRTALRARAGLRPRLHVHRSGKHIYAQVIDDTRGHTLAAASSLDPAVRNAPLPEPVEGGDGLGENHKVRVAVAVGRLIGERARAAGVTKVAFDRSGFIYHGRVRALADAARATGLDF
jgi:large subunit ribosomal protein L18